ncbi:MAG: MFS transporter [Saprospiraceae bacterium]
MNTTSSFEVNDKRIVNAWALFDWANSSFALVITAAIFPAYYVAVVNDTIPMLGTELSDSSLYAYAISASYLLVAALSPLLSGIADYSGRKKLFLKTFTTVGALACMALFFFTGQVGYGTLVFIVAMMGFAGGLVFYNSYLPVIVSEDRYDAVSAKGFAFGFIGSVILLVVNLIIIQNYNWFGFKDQGFATRFAFLMVGVWWIGFAQIPFRRLPQDSPMPVDNQVFKKGFQELRKVWQSLRGEQNIRRFLLAFLCLSAGVQTALYLAATFAEKELGFETGELVLTILILQIVAIGGALLFAKVSEWRGNKFALLIILVIWVLTCIFAYTITTKPQFYITAVSVGMLMGATQSLSRSTYSKLLPANTSDTASYFSFYDVTEKVATVMGTFCFGYINYLTDSMRLSVLSLSAFFLLGFLFLTGTKIQHLRLKKGVNA